MHAFSLPLSSIAAALHARTCPARHFVASFRIYHEVTLFWPHFEERLGNRVPRSLLQHATVGQWSKELWSLDGLCQGNSTVGILHSVMLSGDK
ncbi:uncharacterized protein B0H18DRAFT_1020307 [Fomitopsis serialis]|uniref:uncharacterized protein n=1 Tax=Fomitopsis serialis TaxID=139415 RepID=UPI002008C35E|nr:uncharacterized protein B0H18DRAFT_1020307 [Neoantrodia serialis]KAH9921811.1 hypothetical protein B0H18DRAFT_1020307 [Neoantrodia serialis]